MLRTINQWHNVITNLPPYTETLTMEMKTRGRVLIEATVENLEDLWKAKEWADLG